MRIQPPMRCWLYAVVACLLPLVARAQAVGAHTTAPPSPVCSAEQYSVQMTLQPTSGVYLALGRCFLRVGRPQDALDPLQHAVQLGPGNESAHRLLADALGRLNRNKEAEAEW